MRSRKLLVLMRRRDHLIVDLEVIDVIRIDDSRELGAPDQNTLSFYSTKSDEPAITYNVTQYTAEIQADILRRIVEFLANVDTNKFVIDMDQFIIE